MLHAPCSMLFLSRHILTCLVILCSIATAFSQRPLGSWNVVNTRYNFDSRWSVWAEGQIRSLQFYDEFNYYEVKAAATYSHKDHVAFTAGLGHYETYSPGGNFEEPLVTEETRTWFQVVMDHKLDRINFEHRYRVEQRYINTGYRNRFRYRLNATIPINHRELTSNTLLAYIGDEIFFTNKAPFYERNRFFTGLGYKFSPVISVLSGYMRQFNYSLDSQSSHDYFQLVLNINLNAETFHKNRIPSAEE